MYVAMSASAIFVALKYSSILCSYSLKESDRSPEDQFICGAALWSMFWLDVHRTAPSRPGVCANCFFVLIIAPILKYATYTMKNLKRVRHYDCFQVNFFAAYFKSDVNCVTMDRVHSTYSWILMIFLFGLVALNSIWSSSLLSAGNWRDGMFSSLGNSWSALWNCDWSDGKSSPSVNFFASVGKVGKCKEMD